MKQFYAYVHMKPDGEPFYVGKGSLHRAQDLRQKSRNAWHGRVTQKYGSENIIIEMIECRSEAEAFLREKLVIRALRAKGVVLCNHTDGGEGTTGYKYTVEQRAYTAQRMLGNKHGTNGRSRTGLTNSPESNAKRSASLQKPEIVAATKARHTGNKYNIGRVHSEEQNKQNSLRVLGNKYASGTRTPEQKARIRAAINEANKRPEVHENRSKSSVGNSNASGERDEAFKARMREVNLGNKNASGKRTAEQRARMSAGRIAAKLARNNHE